MNAKDHIAIIGAGTMGLDIAKLFLEQKHSVTLIDNFQESLNRAKKALDAYEQSGLLTLQDSIFFNRMPNIVIEAVPEIAELKSSIFELLEQHVTANTILVSNTSGIPITKLAEALQHKERFLGMHFFMPANVIPIVEVIKSSYTSNEASEYVYELLASVQKMPVMVEKDVPGFIGNRIQHAMAREAISLLEHNIASAEDIDKVVQYALGIRLVLAGPLKQRDLNGLDTHLNIATYLYKDLENGDTPSPLLKEKVEQGLLGVKSGKGFYTWDEEALQQLAKQNRKLQALLAFLES